MCYKRRASGWESAPNLLRGVDGVWGLSCGRGIGFRGVYSPLLPLAFILLWSEMCLASVFMGLMLSLLGDLGSWFWAFPGKTALGMYEIR